VSLPPFDPATGLLPVGEHVATWHDILDRFGWNATRRRQLDGLADALALLAAAGCIRVWLSGSFVTFSEFFQLDRVHGTKGIVVINPRSITS
jgi:hypothetical protein